MNKLVTGADGLNGSHLTESLLAKRHRVKAILQIFLSIILFDILNL